MAHRCGHSKYDENHLFDFVCLFVCLLLRSSKVYRQASCMPDPQGGNCPTSLRAGPGEVKLWLRCGNACWKKNVYFQKEEEVRKSSFLLPLYVHHLRHHMRCCIQGGLSRDAKGGCKSPWAALDRAVTTPVDLKRESLGKVNELNRATQ